MTGKFLRSTGQYTGTEGTRHWVVQKCDCELCATGGFVATDQPAQSGYFTEDEVREQPSLAMRHINTFNLEKAR